MAEITEMETIQYTGVDIISPEQKRLLDKISSDSYPKIKRMLHNMTSLTIHVKAHSKSGSKQKFSIHIKAIAPTKIYVSTKAVDWDFATAVHKAFVEIENEIKHSIRTIEFPKRLPRRMQ
jgi:hypothetical protein